MWELIEKMLKVSERLDSDVEIGDVVRIEDLEDNTLVSASRVTSVRDDDMRWDTYQVIRTEKGGDEEYHGATHLFMKEE